MEPFPAGPLRQPDQFSCGAAVVVVHRMLQDRAHAARIGEHFEDEVLRQHHDLDGFRGADGRLQMPWPRFLGTPPWAISRALAVTTGRGHRVRWVLPWRRRQAFASLRAALQEGPVALYVGNRWLPRHVVLVVDADLHTYEPGRGNVVRVDPHAFVTARLSLPGWTHPWAWVGAA